MGTEFTPSEMRFIRAYRKLDDETQGLYLEAVERQSETEEHRRPAPKKAALRLVVNKAREAAGG